MQLVFVKRSFACFFHVSLKNDLPYCCEKRIEEKYHCDLTWHILDGNFSRKQLIKVLNAELANTMGNLLGRCTGKIINPEQKLPSWNEDSLALCSQASRDLMSQVWKVTQRFSQIWPLTQ